MKRINYDVVLLFCVIVLPVDEDCIERKKWRLEGGSIGSFMHHVFSPFMCLYSSPTIFNCICDKPHPIVSLYLSYLPLPPLFLELLKAMAFPASV